MDRSHVYTYRRKIKKTPARARVAVERTCAGVGIISDINPPVLVERTAIVCGFLLRSDLKNMLRNVFAIIDDL